MGYTIRIERETLEALLDLPKEMHVSGLNFEADFALVKVEVEGQAADQLSPLPDEIEAVYDETPEGMLFLAGFDHA